MKSIKLLMPLAGVTSLLAACSGISPPPTPESARIEVNRTDARVPTLEAFIAEGLVIHSSEGDVIQTMPVEIESQVFVIYRATVLPTRVIFTGIVRNVQGEIVAEMISGAQNWEGEYPLHSAMKGDLGEAWKRLERVAARIRGAS
jgi:hypothetical protein